MGLLTDRDFSRLDSAAASWGLCLSPGQRAQIEGYLGELLEHNRKVNLTAESDPVTLLLRHVADGLAAVPLLKECLSADRAPRILDLGSGGGLIGIPIKIAWPEARVTLAEPLKRKYDFLNLAAARLGLKGLRVLRKSAGQDVFAPQDKGFDAVVARALAPLPEALALGIALARPRGFFLAYQTLPADPEEEHLKKAQVRHSASLVRNFAYRLPLEDRDRQLALFRRA